MQYHVMGYVALMQPVKMRSVNARKTIQAMEQHVKVSQILQ